jgi:NADH-quinone oxidoreductase subunit N
MMVAAFTVRRGAITSWAAVALLIAACRADRRAAGSGPGVRRHVGGRRLSRRFGKVIIFLSPRSPSIMAHGWFERDTEHAAEYPVLILLQAVGMAVMVSATDLMMLYVGLELQSLSAYVLASYRRSDERSAEAGLKYFVLGALASGILLYGISCSTASPAR